MTPRRLLLALLGSTALTVTSILPVAAKSLDVVASFSVLADVVKNVGGDTVQVRSLVPPNGDPHEYEASPDDARALKAAAVTFISGDGLETWFPRLAMAAGAKDKPIVVSAGVKTHSFTDEGKVVTDPHVWNDVANVLIWVDAIETALATADPDDAAVFRANADRYRQTLKALDAEIRQKIEAEPRDRRKVLTSHDAFGYYGKAYGVTFLSPLGVSTETEASAAGIARLINQIRKERVKVYFFENSNDPRLVKQIAAATGAQPGGELYPESLTPADGPAPTYEKMMRFNTDQIVKAIAQ